MGTAMVGSGEYRYEAQDDWAQLPEGWRFVDVVGVATNSKGEVYVFNRGGHPVIVFDRSGAFIRSWGEEAFQRPHGIHIGPDDSVYCTDDVGHSVSKFTPEGKLLLTLEAEGRPSHTGVEGFDYRTMQQVAGPFNLPTNVALNNAGEIYVTDGYGNARVHKYSPDGKLIATWGEAGSGPGQFNLPHGIATDPDGNVCVADRENSRLQWFDPNGRFIEEWTDLARPCQVFVDGAGLVYTAELGYRAGMYSGHTPPTPDASGGRVSIWDRSGKLIARWGGGADPTAPGDFFSPHDIWLDGNGDLYVGEVTWSAGGIQGMVPKDNPSLQKFVRVRA